MRPLSFFRRSFLLSATAAGLFLSACTMMQSGLPVAATKVTASNASEVEDAATEAFRHIGFTFVSNTRGEIVMERPATRTDEVLYGNWNENAPVTERVKIRITEESQPGRFSVAAAPYTVRDVGTGMEDVSRRMTPFAHDYTKAIKEVRARFQ